MAQLIYGTTDRTQGVLNYTVSESASQITISASSDLQAKSYYQSGYQITTSVGSKSTSAEDYIRHLYGSFNTAFSTGTVSETYTKNYSPYTVTVSSSYTGKNVSGYLAGSKSGSTSVTITIPAKASYTVSYNANGGSGAPNAQTKWYGETLILSSTIPTRTGYSFLGWGTSSGDTSVDYNPGGNYTSNASITLYAIWSANTYTVSYNANGGSGAPGNQTKTYGVTLTLSSTKPTRTYYNFLGWSTSSSATTAQYSAGGAFTTNANTTLYAVWQLAYTKPAITSVNIYRANSSGTASDEGTYITYNFSWSIFNSVSLQNIRLQYKLTTASSWTTGATLTPSGTSGTVNTTVGGGLIDITKTYDVRIVITDTRDYSQYYTIVATSSVIIDVDTQNNGVAIGKYSEKANTLEIALDVDFVNPQQARENIGAAPSGYGLGGSANTFSAAQKSAIADFTQTGWYRYAWDVSDNPFYGYGGLVRVEACDICIIQTVYVSALSSDGNFNSVARRQKPSGESSFTAWEYENPPMKLGVEYKTTERYLGNPVYKKVIDFGALPNSTTKSVEHGISNLKQGIRYDIVGTNDNTVFSFYPQIKNVYNGGTSINVVTDSNMSAYTVNIIFSYTKN